MKMEVWTPVNIVIVNFELTCEDLFGNQIRDTPPFFDLIWRKLSALICSLTRCNEVTCCFLESYEAGFCALRITVRLSPKIRVGHELSVETLHLRQVIIHQIV